MWPMLLEMSKLECKKSLRAIELEAYASVVTAFRAQGDLTSKKIEILKDLQSEFKISIDRHKAELRRANNDERLYTIARRLSHGESVSNVWTKQSKRIIPLLPRLERFDDTNTECYYRILADHIVAKSRPVLNLYPDELQLKFEKTEPPKELTLEQQTEDNILQQKNKKTRKKAKEVLNSESDFIIDNQLKPLEDDKNLIYLANDVSVESSCVKIENVKPSEYAKRFKSEDNEQEEESFIKRLFKRYNQQQIEKENFKRETVLAISQQQQLLPTIQPDQHQQPQQQSQQQPQQQQQISTPISIIPTAILQPTSTATIHQMNARPPATLKVSSTQMITKLTPNHTQIVKLQPTMQINNLNSPQQPKVIILPTKSNNDSQNKALNGMNIKTNNGQNTPNSLQKLFMYKTTSLKLDDSKVNENLKILTTTISPQKQIFLNLSKPTPVTASPTTTCFKLTPLLEDKNITNEEGPLKRKLTTIITESSPKSPASSTSSTSSSPPNWSETNLLFIKDMLAKLKQPNQEMQTQNSKLHLQELCENVKEKLERNAYESVEDLNTDLDSIKEKYGEQESANKRIKLENEPITLVQP